MSKFNDHQSLKGVAVEDPWRIFRIMSELVDGFEILSQAGKAVSLFGSAALKRHDLYYRLTEETAYYLAKAGYAVITGGGPGLMEAANKGSRRAGGHSIGLNIIKGPEQPSNRYIDTLIEFRYFFVRKVMFVRYAQAFVIMPGGYGTLDELFEALNLIHTCRIEKFPVVLVGREYWAGLVRWLSTRVVRRGCLKSSDLHIFKLADKPQTVVKIIEDFYGKGKSRCA